VTNKEAKLHFSRFEFKYVLAQALRDEVEAELGHFVELDPYVQGQPNHQYFVRSLYYDNASFTSFKEKVEGQHTRAKFRIRTYARTIDDPAPWFLELKGRYNNLVFKHRTPIQGDFDKTARGEALNRVVLRNGAPGSVRSQFEFDLFKKQIEPTVLVDYERRPYVSRFDPDFRLTFDCKLEATPTDTMFPGKAANTRRMLPGYTVMEVKFRHHVPSWFHRIIQAYELRRRSISKICTGTQALGLQLDPT
jgi:hypothetical protein